MRAVLLTLLVAACSDPAATRRPLDLCGRGDRALLAAALDGGRYGVRVEVGSEVVAEGSVPAAGSALDLDLPDGDAVVIVEGRDADGALVARGEGALDGGGACVCLALDAQAAAACGGVACQVVEDTCRFTDAASGEPAGRQRLEIGASFDTWLDGAAPSATHGGDDTLSVAADAIALLRFDVAGLPLHATIEHAELRLVRIDASTARPALHRVLDAWGDDATAADAPAVDPDGQPPLPGGADRLLYDVTTHVARWVSAPDANPPHGVALTLTADAAGVASAEADGSARPLLVIDYSIEAMGLVPAGTFERGCASTCDPDEESGDAAGCGCDEQPVHEVALSELEIDRTEVTEAAYLECVDAGACASPADDGGCDWAPTEHPNLPVACVTWDDARDYCAFAGKRLPTEAEWERAATGSRGERYPWGDAPPTCDLANSYYCSPGEPAEAARDAVAARPEGASVEGSAEIALDMSGNVWEWVADVYDHALYEELAALAEPPLDPTGPADGEERVRRGGFYFSGEWLLRAGNRDHLVPATAEPGTGFRCAR